MHLDRVSGANQYLAEDMPASRLGWMIWGGASLHSGAAQVLTLQSYTRERRLRPKAANETSRYEARTLRASIAWSR